MCVPLAAMILALRTALGFSLSYSSLGQCMLGRALSSEYTMPPTYLERSIPSTSARYLSCHISIDAGRREGERLNRQEGQERRGIGDVNKAGLCFLGSNFWRNAKNIADCESSDHRAMRTAVVTSASQDATTTTCTFTATATAIIVTSPAYLHLVRAVTNITTTTPTQPSSIIAATLPPLPLAPQLSPLRRSSCPPRQAQAGKSTRRTLQMTRWRRRRSHRSPMSKTAPVPL